MATIKGKIHLFKGNTKGELQNAYSPLQNFVDSNNNLGDFTTSKLNFDKNTPVDLIVTDEYDGSNQIIINDDKNYPKLINSRFSVQENNTFNIPLHNGNSVTNVYEEQSFEKDVQLLKLYDTIPTLEFLGIKEGGAFKCGSYVFYFKLGDIDGNMTNIIQESSIVQMHIGTPNSKKVRMGMQDENSGKCIKFKLSNIDLGFDYVRIFYERKSTDDSQALVDSYFMIDQNFPIRDQQCEILLTGEETTLQIDSSDIKNEFADIQSAKTQTIVDNILFMGNVSSYEQKYKELQQLAWRIIPYAEVKSDENLGQINSTDYSFLQGCAYYDVENVYNNTGYWGDEFYRFGIVFIYKNNILSPVFNIQGCDLGYYFDSNGAYKKKDKEDTIQQYPLNFFKSDNSDSQTKYYYRESEPEDFIFNKKGMHNSKGVIKLPKFRNFKQSNNTFIQPTCIRISFDLSHINDKCMDANGQRVTYIHDDLSSVKEVFDKYNIKGFFFVRQKRIPTIIAQGMVVGLTGRYYGAIPVLRNKKGEYITKSFLNNGRMLLERGSTVVIDETEDKKVSNKALLVPDYDVDEATLNQIFTSQEFYLEKIYESDFKIVEDHHCVQTLKVPKEELCVKNVKLTAVPRATKTKTDGENYFSTLAGNEHEPYKTSDVNNIWNRTPPQNLTQSTSLIRGNWGAYVGMSTDQFDYGDIVNIKLNTFANPDQIELEFQKRFNDFSYYSAITPRYNISDIDYFKEYFTVARGDCFPSLFTHRMMSNFIDPELPTNHQIIDPACWAKNYGVRCTAEILQSTHSNLTSDSDGWYIPAPKSKKSSIVSIIFGILTGQWVMVANAAQDMQSGNYSVNEQDKYANEIVQAFEVYVGDVDKLAHANDTQWTSDSNQVTETTSYKDIIEQGHIKKVNPKEQRQEGLNLKAIFKSDEKWELHGLASINRADVNAVSFGSWITFPICSRYNLAFRDIDFSNATEEARMQRKRSFYPLEDMQISNHMLESNKINGATKVSISTNSHPAYTTVPYIKQEYFNRIYWSKPNVAQSFINSYRIIFKDQYKEYNKEFGSITKILPLGNSLLVVFQHGIGMLPVNRSAQTPQESSPYLSSRNVLPSQVQTLTKDYGSMWKDSVLQTPYGTIYGVDTVAKKLWRINVSGNGLEFISDFKVQKFLNDWIDLSEYDFNEYQGHINVKTHYNAFKRDVIFTYYKDIPIDENGDVVDLSGNLVLEDTEDVRSKIVSWKPGKTWSLCFNEVTGNFVTFYDWYPIESCNIDNIYFSFDKDAIEDTYNNKDKVDIFLPKISRKGDDIRVSPMLIKGGPNTFSVLYTTLVEGVTPEISELLTDVKYRVDFQNLEIIPSSLRDHFITYKEIEIHTISVLKIDLQGNVYCSEVLIGQLEPIRYESGSLPNGYYYKDKQVYKQNNNEIVKYENYYYTNKYFIDNSFTNNCQVSVIVNDQYNDKIIEDIPESKYISFYYKLKPVEEDTFSFNGELEFGSDGWKFVIMPNEGQIDWSASKSDTLYIAEIRCFDEILDTDEKGMQKYYRLRDSEVNRMYLWKHGQSGLYTNKGKIRPTHWYGKQHEFNFEFVINESPVIQKIFNNLKIISNKTAPNKFEYEIVGEGYDWFYLKPVIIWINQKFKEYEEKGDYSHGTTEKDRFEFWYKEVLSNTYSDLRYKYPDFPEIFELENNRTINKLPFLHLETTDRKGMSDKNKTYLESQYWDIYKPDNTTDYKYQFNSSETILVNDEDLNEQRVHTESLGNDIKRYGRIRGNMQYLEDLWDIEIRPVKIQWACLNSKNELVFKKTETRHRDKYCKIKVRYTGQDLALIQGIITMFDVSRA